MVRSRLTYANVMATLAVFVALGGSSYAAFKLPKNAVKSQNIAPNAVSSPKVGNGSLKAEDVGAGQGPQGAAGPQGSKGETGSPTAPAGGGLDGNYPNPSIRAPEAQHQVGSAGEPSFQNGWSAVAPVTFRKDRAGMVHLTGVMDTNGRSTGTIIFTLPAGYRPCDPQPFAVLDGPGAAGQVDVSVNGDVTATNFQPTANTVVMSLSDINFSSGC